MSVVKKIKELIRLQVRVGEANPTPPLGPVLGSRGINLVEFCKRFNAESISVSNLLKGTLVTVVITLFEDKSFFFLIKTPPTTYLVKKFLNVEKGCNKPKKGEQSVMCVSLHDIKEIVKIKRKDLFVKTEESAIKIVCGSVLSMGFSVEES